MMKTKFDFKRINLANFTEIYLNNSLLDGITPKFSNIDEWLKYSLGGGSGELDPIVLDDVWDDFLSLSEEYTKDELPHALDYRKIISMAGGDVHFYKADEAGWYYEVTGDPAGPGGIAKKVTEGVLLSAMLGEFFDCGYRFTNWNEMQSLYCGPIQVQ